MTIATLLPQGLVGFHLKIKGVRNDRQSHSLEGKLVLVTGTGTGIGRGVAIEAARMGADVVLHYASSDEGELTVI
jgi:phosphoglycerate dehydrogenase-like enzyme